MPRVSVIIPCYNYAGYLPDAVESVVSQTFRDFDVIVVDDGSPDDTAEVAAGLIKKHPECSIRLVRQENRGLPVARNTGIECSSSEFFVPLDADDMLTPGYLERMVAEADKHPGRCLYYAWSRKFGEDTEVIEHREFDREAVLFHIGPHPTALIRRSAWEAVGGYNPVMNRGAEDKEFYFSLFEAGCTGYVVKEPLFLYRKHGYSMTVDMNDNHALAMAKNIKLLHPRMYEPFLCSISVPLARVVIRLKCRLRDPLAHYLYVKHPRLHSRLAKLKYSLLKR